MLPLIAGAAIGIGAGIYSAYKQGQAASDARKATNAQIASQEKMARERQAMLDSQAAQGQRYIDANDTEARLAQAGKMYQAASDHEVNQAIQGGLLAFGGSPLSGNARQAVYSNLADQARSNWQQAIANADGMMSKDVQNRLGVQQGLMSGTAGIGNDLMTQKNNSMGSLANLAATQNTGVMDGIMTGLTAYGKLK
jgi:hypothetical protein